MSEIRGLSLPMSDCWNRIGVKGDRSCARLPEVRHCQHCPVFADAASAFLDRPAPDGYVEEMTALLAKSATAGQEAVVLSVVVFEVGDQTLAIDTRAVLEVTEPRPVHRVAHRSGRVFTGLVNIHGQLELCASLKGLLQIASEPAPRPEQSSAARMLLVEHFGQRWVFDAHAVHGLHRFKAREIFDVPATALHDSASFICKVLRLDERRVGYLDVDKTFAALGRTLR
jgi:chemotaxis-related protein WspD